MSMQQGTCCSSSSGPSWLADLDAYIASHQGDYQHGGHGPGGSEDCSAERQQLVGHVKAAPQSAEAWQALLAFEEAHSGNLTQQQGAKHDASKVSLYHLYYYATQLVPRAKNQQKESYLQLWLGFARQQWTRSQDDARDTFKTLKNQHIGDASAHLFHEWAVLEHSAGNVSKALGIVNKGLRAEAQPSSILEQLRAELQSGVLDIKGAGTFTETLTLDAGAITARQVESTPVPCSTAGHKTNAAHTSGTSSHAAGFAAAATTARGSSLSSCLKAPTAALVAGVAASHDQHGGRAVTFAADVHSASGGHDAFGHAHRGGSVSACSSRSTVHTGDCHSGCISIGSTSSRSTASVHDTVAFTASAVSYKSSTTESSGIMDGAEEDTISCRVAGQPGTACTSRDTNSAKPSTAPLSGVNSAATAAGGGSNTATLGLKRFGFKSRALRVGGAADTPAAGLAAAAPVAPEAASGTESHRAAAAGAGKAAGSTAGGKGAGVATGLSADDGGAAGAAGRKRRAGTESMPSPNTSPKLAAAVRHGQPCKVQPDDVAGSSRNQPGAASGAQHERQAAGSSKAGACLHRSSPDSENVLPRAATATPSDDDSVPLVSSKLAARLAADGATPLNPGRGASAAVRSMGTWSSPVDGQLPSSLDTTPSEAAGTGSLAAVTRSTPCAPSSKALPAGDQSQQAGKGTMTASKHSLHQSIRSHEQQMVPQQQQQQQQCASNGSLGGPSSRQRTAPPPAAAYSHASVEAGGDADDDGPPLPTIVLPDVADVAAGSTAAHEPAQPAIKAAGGRQQQQQHHAAEPHSLPQQHVQQQAVAREPLRPLQPMQQAAGAAQHVSHNKPLANSSSKSAASHAHMAAAGSHSQQQPRQAMAPPQQVQRSQQQQPQQQQQQQQQRPQQQQGQVVRQSRPKEDAQTVFVQGVRYAKLECVGRGGSSKVFKVMGPGCKIFALKRIKLAGRDAEAASGFIDEINLLNSLKDKPNIIQLVDSQVFTDEGLIYMVQEYGEIDLARLLHKHATARREAAGSGATFHDDLDENFIRLYWQQMLQAVAGVHEQRIVHSDLKPANFLLVEGQLKLIDFGIAKAISGDTTSIARESQVGTLNYMSPEAILGGSNNILGGPAMKVGRPSDVWSLGCILYQMVYGRTPFADLPFLPKMHAICNPQHRISYPQLANKDLMDVMQRCLDRDPKTRITLQDLLDHPFLHPNRATHAAPTAVPALSEEQMKLLVAQVQAAGAAGVTDLDKLTRELMQKLGTTSLGSGSSSSAGASSSNSSDDGGGVADRQLAAASTARVGQHQQQRQVVGQQRQHSEAAGPSVGGSSISRPRIPGVPAAPPTWR